METICRVTLEYIRVDVALSRIAFNFNLLQERVRGGKILTLIGLRYNLCFPADGNDMAMTFSVGLSRNIELCSSKHLLQLKTRKGQWLFCQNIHQQMTHISTVI